MQAGVQVAERGDALGKEWGVPELVLVINQYIFRVMSLPVPQSQFQHCWHLVQGAPGRGERVGRLAGLGGRVGGGKELPDLGWRLLSLPAQPGGMVAFVVAVVYHLA